MTLADVIPVVQQLSTLDKLKLIRLLAETLEASNDPLLQQPNPSLVSTMAADPAQLLSESTQSSHPFERDKVYYLHTPYNSFGAADILAKALDSKKSQNQAAQ